MRDPLEERELDQLLGRDDPGCPRRGDLVVLDAAAVGQGPGRAGDHALAARDARRVAHRVVEVEGDPGGEPLAHPAEHLVVLDVVAAPDASVAEDAGGVVDGDDDRRVVAGPGRGLGEPGRADLELLGHQLELAVAVSRCLAQGEGWSVISSSASVLTESRTLALVSAVSILRPAMSGVIWR